MAEITYTEKEITDSMFKVIDEYRKHYDRMSFHDMILVENVMYKFYNELRRNHEKKDNKDLKEERIHA